MSLDVKEKPKHPENLQNFAQKGALGLSGFQTQDLIGKSAVTSVTSYVVKQLYNSLDIL